MARHFLVKFCQRCGAEVEYQEIYDLVRPVCPQCKYIHFQDPKVAAAVLIEDESRVLLIQRANEPFRGLWTLPAGFVNGGEAPAEAATRECLEETGLSVQIMHVLDVIAGREHERGADFIIVYAGRVLSGEILAADDAQAAAWFERDALPALAFSATKKILNVL